MEIDIVGEEDDHLLIGECKFSSNKKGIKEYIDMKEDASIKPFDNYQHKHYYLFSHNGFSDELINKKFNDLHLISSKLMVGEE